MRTVRMVRVGVVGVDPMAVSLARPAWDGDAAGRPASQELRCGPLDDDGYDDEHDDYDLDEDDDYEDEDEDAYGDYDEEDDDYVDEDEEDEEDY